MEMKFPSSTAGVNVTPGMGTDGFGTMGTNARGVTVVPAPATLSSVALGAAAASVAGGGVVAGVVPVAGVVAGAGVVAETAEAIQLAVTGWPVK